MKLKLLTTGLILAGAISVASAGKFDQTQKAVLESTSPAVSQDYFGAGVASSITLDFSTAPGENWDGLDDPSNVISTCISGGTIEGVEWVDLTVTTEGASWLSEASLFFSNTSGAIAQTGLFLTVGVGEDAPGVGVYNSNGIIDLSDNGIPDIVAEGDGSFTIQFFESFDDSPDAIDSNFTSGELIVYGLDLVENPGCAYSAIPPEADLSVSVTNNSPGILEQGDTVTFTTTVTNNGPGTANNTSVTTTFDDGLSYVSNSCGATAGIGSLSWDAGSIANGASATCDTTFTLEGFGRQNVAASASADEADSVSSNNSGGSGVNGPAQIIPTLTQYGLFLLLAGMIFISRRKFLK